MTAHAATMGESLSDTVQLTEQLDPRSMKSGIQVINMRREYSNVLTSHNVSYKHRGSQTETWRPDQRASPSLWAITMTFRPTNVQVITLRRHPLRIPLPQPPPQRASHMPSRETSSMRRPQTTLPTRQRQPPKARIRERTRGHPLRRGRPTGASSMQTRPQTLPTRRSLPAAAVTSRPLCDTILSQ